MIKSELIHAFLLSIRTCTSVTLRRSSTPYWTKLWKLCIAETEWSYEVSERFRLSSGERARGVTPVPELSSQSHRKPFPPSKLQKKA
jgi:hypothetical protein